MKPNHRPPHRPTGIAHAQALLTLAVTHHQNGQLAEAAMLYQQMMKRLPKQADALHLSGLIKAQTGALAEAIERIRQAIKADPRQPVFHANPGRPLDAAGERAYRHARAPRPDPGLALAGLGLARPTLGLHGEAVAAFRAALDQTPDDAAIRSNMLFCLCSGDHADPIEVFREHCAFERHLPAVPAASHAVESQDPERRLRGGWC